jgi:hypothetical protein
MSPRKSKQLVLERLYMAYRLAVEKELAQTQRIALLNRLDPSVSTERMVLKLMKRNARTIWDFYQNTLIPVNAFRSPSKPKKT